MEESKKHLDDMLRTIAREQKYEDCEIKIKQLDSGGANYSSYIFAATISSAGKPDLNLFAKVAVSGGDIRNNLENIYQNEAFFYKTFLKIYRDLEERHGISEEHRLRTAKYYTCSTKQFSETLVLEDLNSRAFKSFDRFKSVTWHQTAECLGQLAKFHALSFALSYEEPMQFHNVKKKITYSTDLFEKIVRSCLPQVIEATEDINKKRIADFMEYNLNSEDFSLIYKPMSKEVIIHADYRPNNLMYKTENGKCQVVILDLQTIRCGTPVYDLLYFINCGFHAEFREKYYQAAIDHYYAELRSALQRFKLNPDEVYSRKVFDFELNEMLPYTVTLGLCFLLALTVDEDDATKDLDEFDVHKMMYPVNDLFKKRLNEFIQFYSKMGVIP